LILLVILILCLSTIKIRIKGKSKISLTQGSPLTLPYRVGGYDLGRFQTAGGPLHVSAGVGTFHFNVRFHCPPEVVLVEL
jgi:predicted MPP superfamily phosphohydrolase